MLKGQYTYSLNNNYTDFSFTPWSEDHEPSELLVTIMRQSLVNNFATNCNQPKVNTVEQDTPPKAGPSRQAHVLQIGVTIYT